VSRDDGGAPQSARRAEEEVAATRILLSTNISAAVISNKINHSNKYHLNSLIHLTKIII
jgi:hypothetical protein